MDQYIEEAKQLRQKVRNLDHYTMSNSRVDLLTITAALLAVKDAIEKSNDSEELRWLRFEK